MTTNTGCPVPCSGWGGMLSRSPGIPRARMPSPVRNGSSPAASVGSVESSSTSGGVLVTSLAFFPSALLTLRGRCAQPRSPVLCALCVAPVPFVLSSCVAASACAAVTASSCHCRSKAGVTSPTRCAISASLAPRLRPSANSVAVLAPTCNSSSSSHSARPGLSSTQTGVNEPSCNLYGVRHTIGRFGSSRGAIPEIMPYLTDQCRRLSTGKLRPRQGLNARPVRLFAAERGQGCLHRPAVRSVGLFYSQLSGFSCPDSPRANPCSGHATPHHPDLSHPRRPGFDLPPLCPSPPHHLDPSTPHHPDLSRPRRPGFDLPPPHCLPPALRRLGCRFLTVLFRVRPVPPE